MKKPDLGKLKDILAVARKHLTSVIAGVLALAAVVACFWPTAGMYQSLAQQVTDRIAVINNIKTLEHQSRSLPAMSPDDAAQPLAVFPNADVVRQGKQRVADLQTASEQMLSAAIGLNQHIPLYRAAFFSGPPDARVEGDPTARTEYAQRYVAAVLDGPGNPGDARIRTWPAADAQLNHPKNNPIPPLNAGMAPSDADLAQATTDLQNQVNNDVLQKDQTTGNYTPESQQRAAQIFAIKSRTLAFQMAEAEAAKCKVYIQPGALKRSAALANFTGNSQAPSSSDIWDAQRYLWIQEDVATAVAYANAPAADVTQSAVKQIVDVELPSPTYIFMGNGDQSTILDDGQVPLQRDLSFTGHVTNGMYDVIHFTVQLDVDAAKIPDVVWAMQRGQFISVLNLHFKTLDSPTLIDSRFIYGPGPVVRLSLDCEELLLKKWVSDLAPPAAPPPTPAQ